MDRTSHSSWVVICAGDDLGHDDELVKECHKMLERELLWRGVGQRRPEQFICRFTHEIGKFTISFKSLNPNGFDYAEESMG